MGGATDLRFSGVRGNSACFFAIGLSCPLFLRILLATVYYPFEFFIGFVSYVGRIDRIGSLWFGVNFDTLAWLFLFVMLN